MFLLSIHNINGDIMRIRLGYVAVPLTLMTTSSHTMTYQKFSSLKTEEAYYKLDQIVCQNLEALMDILRYNLQQGIYFFRITSLLVPLATHPKVLYDPFQKFASSFEKIGKYVIKHDMRVDTHPDQFCVLNSINASVVQSSINILEFHRNMFCAMKIDGKCVLHLGSSALGKEESIKRFCEQFNLLSDDLKKMIMLENDDKVYTIVDVLSVCESLHIPMVLDYHHYRCNHGNEKLEDYLERIFATWDGTGLPPKVHFSSPASRKKYRNHSDYVSYASFIKFIDLLKKVDYDVDIMIEAKGKDEALLRLSRQIRYYSGYKLIKNAIFFV